MLPCLQSIKCEQKLAEWQAKEHKFEKAVENLLEKYEQRLQLWAQFDDMSDKTTLRHDSIERQLDQCDAAFDAQTDNATLAALVAVRLLRCLCWEQWITN